jgi:hypothetical protein
MSGQSFLKKINDLIYLWVFYTSPLSFATVLIATLIFLLTQFYPILVPFAQKCAWTSPPSTLT